MKATKDPLLTRICEAWIPIGLAVISGATLLVFLSLAIYTMVSSPLSGKQWCPVETAILERLPEATVHVGEWTVTLTRERWLGEDFYEVESSRLGPWKKFYVAELPEGGIGWNRRHPFWGDGWTPISPD